jgi:hypothetical protein
MHLSVLMLAIITLSTALAQQPAPGANPEAHAQEVLKQARTVIWDETKSKPLQSLSISANRRFTRGGNQIEVEMALEALLPDKFRQTDIFTLNVGSDFISIRAINGSQVWSDFESTVGTSTVMKKRVADNPAGTSGNKTKGGIRAMLEELGGGAGAPERSDEQSRIQWSFARLLLVWLLTTPPSLPVEFSYAGQAKAQAGIQTADVLNVTGPNNFAARLFINPQTHQVMMLTYKTVVPGKRAGENSATESEVRWVVSDYRNVDGLHLPHQLVILLDGRPIEEVNVKKVKINPSLKPNRFEQKN